MRQHTRLCGHLPAVFKLIKAFQDPFHASSGPIHRIQADYRITAAIAEPFHYGCHDAGRIVRGVVWLQPRGKSAGQADRGIAVGGHLDFGCCVNQIQISHQLTDRGYHFAGQAPGYLPYHFIINGFVYIILNNSGNLILFIGNGRIFTQIG